MQGRRLANAFSAVSLIVDVAEPSGPPDTLVIRHPAKHRPALSHIILHETLHFWQHLASGYLVRIAAEEFRRLLAFEATGEAPPAGPLLRAFITRDRFYGYSPRDLLEALTRYWEFHICGVRNILEAERAREAGRNPEFWSEVDALIAAGAHHGPGDPDSYSDIAFALGMRGAGGRYARPYNAAVEASSTAVAGLVFPIAAHLAFQTSDPLRFYPRFLDALSPIARDYLPASFEDLVVDLYHEARGAAFRILKPVDETPLMSIVEIREAGLHDHPGWLRAHSHVEWYALNAHDTDEGRKLLARFPKLSEKNAGLLLLDRLLATPGVPLHRSALLQFFPPHLVRFADDAAWMLGHQHAKELGRGEESEKLPYWTKLADDARDMDARWAAFTAARAIRGTPHPDTASH